MNNVIAHYDALIDENNDPVHDPLPLKEYMDKWDGQNFIDSLQILPHYDVLEIGIGTGRLAVRICGYCNTFAGIDLSPKTIERAADNLRSFGNFSLICADFLAHQFLNQFDVIYSSLTFIHIQDKEPALAKVAALLKKDGHFILSMSKCQDKELQVNGRKIELFPATAKEMRELFLKSGLTVIDFYETEFAFIIIAKKSDNSEYHRGDNT